MTKNTAIVIGAGPGGACAAMLLAARGWDVTVYEKEAMVGGRNAAMTLGGYTFDTGPTFLMLPSILEEMFEQAGTTTAAEMELKRLDPLYRLQFPGVGELDVTQDRDLMAQRLEALFPGDGAAYEGFLRSEGRKFRHIFPCLRCAYDKPWHYLRAPLLRALPYLDAHRSVYNVIARHFRHEHARLAMTFQAKYLGMSPWTCPGTFTILPYMEHVDGIYHPVGGLNAISRSMIAVAERKGAAVHLSTPVERMLIEGGRARGVVLPGGKEHRADAVFVNADFAHAMRSLVPERHRRRWTDKRIAAARYSCSTYVLYLGVRGRFDHLPHHTIAFAQDYRANVADIVEHGRLSDDFSFYLQNASVTDPTLAPDGCSTLYALVPVPNMTAGIDWAVEGPRLRERVIDAMERRLLGRGIRDAIEAERAMTPADWERSGVHRGAVFNLAHDLGQMLYLRPRNRFEDIRGCYLVGGGTHPGSGLPTILESANISARLASRDAGL